MNGRDVNDAGATNPGKKKLFWNICFSRLRRRDLVGNGLWKLNVWVQSPTGETLLSVSYIKILSNLGFS